MEWKVQLDANVTQDLVDPFVGTMMPWNLDAIFPWLPLSIQQV